MSLQARSKGRRVSYLQMSRLKRWCHGAPGPPRPSFGGFSVTAVVDGQLRPRETRGLSGIPDRLSLVLFKCLTGEIRQANLPAPLRDTAREKNISPDLGVSDADTF